MIGLDDVVVDAVDTLEFAKPKMLFSVGSEMDNMREVDDLDDCCYSASCSLQYRTR